MALIEKVVLARAMFGRGSMPPAESPATLLSQDEVCPNVQHRLATPQPTHPQGTALAWPPKHQGCGTTSLLGVRDWGRASAYPHYHTRKPVENTRNPPAKRAMNQLRSLQHPYSREERTTTTAA